MTLLCALLVACAGGSESSTPDDTPAPSRTRETSTLPALAATPTLMVPTATPEPTATPAFGGPDPAARMLIPSLGVDAPIGMERVGPDGRSPLPDVPEEVVMSDLTAFQGLGGYPGAGNAIYYGILSSLTPCAGGVAPPPCPGVFYDLFTITPGAEVTVTYFGQPFQYTVAVLCHVLYSDYPQTLFNGAGPERVTLLTDAFITNAAGEAIDYQTVVIAERVAGSVTACPEGSFEGPYPVL